MPAPTISTNTATAMPICTSAAAPIPVSPAMNLLASRRSPAVTNIVAGTRKINVTSEKARIDPRALAAPAASRSAGRSRPTAMSPTTPGSEKSPQMTRPRGMMSGVVTD